MLDFLINDKTYEIQANAQLSTVLSQFDSAYVMDVIEDTLTRRLNQFDLYGPPNAVDSFEQVFNEMRMVYPNEQDTIADSRHEVYANVIDCICNYMDLQYQPSDDIDLYTLARNMYDFYVARLDNYIVTFYDRYITAEKDHIYSSFHLDDMRKSKDVGTIYSNKVFGDGDSISLIIANLSKVLETLRHMPVSDEQVYRIIYGPMNEHIVQLFMRSLLHRTSVFDRFNSILFNENMYPTVITHIRLAIQQSHLAELNAAARLATGAAK